MRSSVLQFHQFFLPFYQTRVLETPAWPLLTDLNQYAYNARYRERPIH